MRLPQIRLAALALVTGVALGGCAYGLGDPYGSYGGVNVGYGSSYGYGYDPYYGYAGYGGYPYGGYGYGYGDPFGWYGNYYYPGTGIYVYDRHHHRRVMTDRERSFWTDVIKRTHNGTTANTTASISPTVAPRENWSGFNRSRSQTSASTTTSPPDGARHWRNRSSSTTTTTTTTTSSSDPTPRMRADAGGHSRGHNRANDQ